LQSQGRAELCLTAGALEEDDQVTGYSERHRTAEILSTSASARSIPAVTPAEVQTGPSHTKIGSG
jgi:hypothetical protein